LFNADNENNPLKSRSRAKGPEPEGLVLAEIWGRNFAFIGLERTGGVMVYEYEIQGNYGYGWDLLTTEDTIKEARAQVETYRANETIPLRIKRVRAGE
jgi:hypothetical protein